VTSAAENYHAQIHIHIMAAAVVEIGSDFFSVGSCWYFCHYDFSTATANRGIMLYEKLRVMYTFGLFWSVLSKKYNKFG
jgi:hypothetical protein